ncbi:MAG: hypothetical protein WB005_11565, partial [Pseudolabrys sp.]
LGAGIMSFDLPIAFSDTLWMKYDSGSFAHTPIWGYSRNIASLLTTRCDVRSWQSRHSIDTATLFGVKQTSRFEATVSTQSGH